MERSFIYEKIEIQFGDWPNDSQNAIIVKELYKQSFNKWAKREYINKAKKFLFILS